MTVSELRKALKSGVTLIWQGKHDYKRARGSLTGIILRKGPSGEDVFSAELTSISATSGRNSIIICRPEELSLWHPADKSNEVSENGNQN